MRAVARLLIESHLDKAIKYLQFAGIIRYYVNMKLGSKSNDGEPGIVDRKADGMLGYECREATMDKSARLLGFHAKSSRPMQCDLTAAGEGQMQRAPVQGDLIVGLEERANGSLFLAKHHRTLRVPLIVATTTGRETTK